MTGPQLTAARRARDLDMLSESTVDVLVVGGGVTGCGVALDASSRGLSVALVEKVDLAYGTSRWSSKLVHGGLRYLASGDVSLAYESARERSTLMQHTAPHLVRALPMAVPLSRDVTVRQGMLIDAGHRTADLLRRVAGTSRTTLPPPRRISVAETVRLLPAVRRDSLRGALVNWDGQLEDDARLVVALARTAASYGARIITRAQVVHADGSGAQVRDTLTGSTVRLRARAVVNAAGVWAGTVSGGTQLRPSKGVHLVLPSMLLGHPAASMTVPVPGEHNRYVFALPTADGLVHVGLTDDPVDGPLPEVPVAEEHEIAFLLDTLGRGLELPLSRSDVVGSFAGIRPLLAGAEGRTADLSRHHSVVHGDDGTWTVLGGKLTTYRRMAQDAVDRLTDVPCRTARLPLVGAAGPMVGSGSTPATRVPARLIRRYGSEATAVASLGAADPRLLDPIAPGVPVLGVEFAWGVIAEGALTADDLLERRTRVSLVDAWHEAARPAAEAALAVAV